MKRILAMVAALIATTAPALAQTDDRIPECVAQEMFEQTFGRTAEAPLDWLRAAPSIETGYKILFNTPEALQLYADADVSPWFPHLSNLAHAECGIRPDLSIEAQIRRTFPENPSGAVAVAHCESSLQPDAVGPAGERGIMQIHPVHIPGLIAELGYTWNDMFQVGPNLEVARAIYDDAARWHWYGPWGPWTCARKLGVR